MKNRGFDFGDFEITKREILASISIIAMMLLIGFVISGRISKPYLIILHFMKTAPLKKLLIIWKAIGNYGYSG